MTQNNLLNNLCVIRSNQNSLLSCYKFFFTLGLLCCNCYCYHRITGQVTDMQWKIPEIRKSLPRLCKSETKQAVSHQRVVRQAVYCLPNILVSLMVQFTSTNHLLCNPISNLPIEQRTDNTAASANEILLINSNNLCPISANFNESLEPRNKLRSLLLVDSSLVQF